MLISRLKTFVTASAALLSLMSIPRVQSEQIRVGLHFGDHAPSSVTISGQGCWEAERSQGHLAGAIRISSTGEELELSRSGTRLIRIGRWVKLNSSGTTPTLVLGGRSYRGLLKIEAQPAGGLAVINTLNLEDYLQGVVPNEMFAIPRAFAALEVQAVISRTLAMFIRSDQPRHHGEEFDVCATGHCQVYRGASSETANANEAIQRTRGQVLTYRGKAILAAYHANAGGQTASTDEVWPGSIRLKYLEPVSSPHDDFAYAFQYGDCYQWRETVKSEEIRGRVHSITGQDVGPVREVLVTQSGSGRIRDLRIIGGWHNAVIRSPRDIRIILGLMQEATGKPYDHDIRLVSVQKTQDDFIITGYGAGEGVGLSQHGAVGMARAGYTYTEILGHYYREVDLTQDYGSGSLMHLRTPDLGMKGQTQRAEKSGGGLGHRSFSPHTVIRPRAAP